MASETFDLETVYDEEIAPLMDRIIAICKREKMPMLATFLYERSVEDSPDDPAEGMCTTVLDWPDEGRGCRTINIVSQVVQRGLGKGETLRVLPTFGPADRRYLEERGNPGVAVGGEWGEALRGE